MRWIMQSTIIIGSLKWLKNSYSQLIISRDIVLYHFAFIQLNSGGRGPPICPPGYVPPGTPGDRRCNVRRTTTVITRGFAQLYCSQRRLKRHLSPITFLISYFKKFKTRTNYLPRTALQKSLRQSLPRRARRIRRKLNSLRWAFHWFFGILLQSIICISTKWKYDWIRNTIKRNLVTWISDD